MARRRRVPPRRQGEALPAPAQGFWLRGLLVVAIGLITGTLLALLTPTIGLSAADRARAALVSDTAASLTTAAALANDGDPSLLAIAALARTLLALDHAGGSVEKKRAEALVQTPIASVRTAPETLYARALWQREGREDPALDEDIANRGDKSPSAFALLARGSRALAKGKREDALALLRQAALGVEPPLVAQTEFARALIASGELADARAIAERARRASPRHGPSRMLGILAAVLEDAREETIEDRKAKLKKVRAQAMQRGKKPAGDEDPARALALWRTREEEEATDALDHLDERDGALLALFLQALAEARGDDELASSLRARVLPVAARYPVLAARQIELSLLVGDLDTVEDLFAALEPAALLEDEPDLALARARLASLKLIAPQELRTRAGARSLTSSGAVLPFGEFAFHPSARSIPLLARFRPILIPEAALSAAMRSGARGATLEKNLATAVLVHKGDAALRRGDLAGAAEAAAQATESSASGAEALFLDARIRLRQGDKDGARLAIDAATAASPNDPQVLLVAARLLYDGELFIPARQALTKLASLGLKSASALALSAMLDAREGRSKSAQAALEEARVIGADQGSILRANVLILRAGNDLPAAREAANKLLDVDQLQTTDPILRAWQADAIGRAGDRGKATAVLEQLIEQSSVGDAHYFLAELTGDLKGYARAAELAPATVLATRSSTRPAKPTHALPLPRPTTAK